MKVLITGYSGFISRNLINFLLEKKNIEIYVISRKKRHKSKNLNIYIFNLTNKQQVKKFTKLKNKPSFDIVFHTASITAKKKNLNDFNAFKRNLQITYNIIEILKFYKFKKIVNFSSSSVYPNMAGVHNEESKIGMKENKDCLYGLSKFSSEMLLSYYFKSKKILNLRISQVYGTDMPPYRIISSMINSVRKNNKVLIYGNGKRLINLIAINQLISYLFKLIKKKYSGVYNVSSLTISIKNLVTKIIKKYGNSETKIIFLKNKKNNSNFILSSKKIDAALKLSKKDKKIIL